MTLTDTAASGDSCALVFGVCSPVEASEAHHLLI